MAKRPSPTYFDKARGMRFSYRTGRVVCACGCGYGSEYDGKCTRCRKGVTAWEQKRKDQGK